MIEILEEALNELDSNSPNRARIQYLINLEAQRIAFWGNPDTLEDAYGTHAILGLRIEVEEKASCATAQTEQSMLAKARRAYASLYELLYG